MKIFKKIQKRLQLNQSFQRIRRILRGGLGYYDLPFILTHIDESAPLRDQLFWFEHLLKWILTDGELPEAEHNRNSIQIVRIKFLFHVLGRNPEWRLRLSKSLRVILRDSSFLQLFSQTGLHQEMGFWSEAANRSIKSLLPTPPNDSNFDEFLARVFGSQNDLMWLDEITADMLSQWIDLIELGRTTEEEPFGRLRSDLSEAIVVLSATVGGIGFSKEMMTHFVRAPRKSPFFLLQGRVMTLIGGLDLGVESKNFEHCIEQIHECRHLIAQVFSNLEAKGVSVSVVYRLEQLQVSLNRIEILLHLLLENSLGIVIQFLSELLREQKEHRGVMNLFKSNLRLLSRKVVERAGVSGEHYITSTRAEYFGMLKAGLGGGLLTVLTTLVKSWISHIKLAYFWDFFLSGFNYAGSFVTIQFFGFALATKQPSATAAHLSGKLVNLNSQERLNEFVEDFKKIARSQFAAAVGNIGMAMPASFMFCFLYFSFFGEQVFSTEYAKYTLGSLNPFGSLTIIYASLTGVWLWLSSLIGGWFENWLVFRRVPEAISYHRGLRERLGPLRTQQLGEWLAHNAAGLGGNTSLGFLLAGVPIFTKIFGFALEVRHVTLSSCAFAMAVYSLWGQVSASEIGFALFGILAIGVLNFGVSFYLALTVAARARSLDQSTVLFLLKLVGEQFLKAPKHFFVP